MARGLRMSRTWTIGLVVPALRNPMYTHIIRGAQTRAVKAGYGLILGSQVETQNEETFGRLLSQGRVDGLLVASASLNDAFIRSIVDAEAGPVVLVNRHIEGLDSSALVDDVAGSRLATDHLIQLGHHDIAILVGPSDIDTSIRRLQGFEDAMRAAGIEDATVVHAGGWDASDGYRAAEQVLSESAGITAMFASTMMLGVGALRAIHEAGLHIPAEMSVICLHDDEMLEYTIPPLTTIRMRLEELGAAAFDQLMARIEGRPGEVVVVPGEGELVERDSVAPPNDRAKALVPLQRARPRGHTVWRPIPNRKGR